MNVSIIRSIDYYIFKHYISLQRHHDVILDALTLQFLLSKCHHYDVLVPFTAIFWCIKSYLKCGEYTETSNLLTSYKHGKIAPKLIILCYSIIILYWMVFPLCPLWHNVFSS